MKKGLGSNRCECSDTIIVTHNELKASEYYKEIFYLYVVYDPIGNPRLTMKQPPLKIVDEKYVVQYIVKFTD